MKLIRYLIGVSTLPILVFIRINMGYNMFGPWHNKSYGFNSGKYATTWYGRILFLLPTMFWILVFAIGSFTEALQKSQIEGDQFDLFFAEQDKLLSAFDLVGSMTHVFENIGSNVLVVVSIILILYVPVFLILSFAYLFSFDQANWEHEGIDQSGLGDSLIFLWFTKEDFEQSFDVLSLYEPLLFAIVAVILYLSNALMASLFVGLGAFGLFLQGQQTRMRYRRHLDELHSDQALNKKVWGKEMKIKKTNPQKRDSLNTDNWDKPTGGANPL